MHETRNRVPEKPRSFIPVVAILAAVTLNALSSILLKTLADHHGVSLQILFAVITIALLLNGLRLLIWMYAHQRYPLSTTYPLTSLFFPIMLGVAYAYGDPVGPMQWIGTLLITAGVFWLSWKVPT